MLFRSVAIACFAMLSVGDVSRLAAQIAQSPVGEGFSIANNGEMATVLGRLIAVDLRQVSIITALHILGQSAGTTITYSAQDSELDTNFVSLVDARISLRDALDRILARTNLHVALIDKHVVITRDSLSSDDARRVPPLRGSIAGTVLDAQSKAPLGDAEIVLQGTSNSTFTDLRGRYRLKDVAAGVHVVVARRLGYLESKKQDTVVAGQTDTVNLALVSSPALLDEVVTTVTGNETKRELGNNIATIAADSIVANAPITNISDLISGRAAGVQVFVAGGLTDASPQINIRGQNSVALSNQPLLVVDGVRIDNSLAGAQPGNGPVGTNPGGLNDINSDDIESIEIVRGPSAATLYGTDAANGVIVVTTKHGTVGVQRWSVYAEQGMVAEPTNRFLEDYSAWGHSLDGANTITNDCSLQDVAGGLCRQDSITHFSPLKDPVTTPIGTGASQNYGLQVSGGRDIRYFASGYYEDQTGYLKLPQDELASALLASGAQGVPSYERHPDGVTKYGARENLTTKLASTADLTLSGAYTSRESHLPNPDAIVWGESGPGYRDANDGYLLGITPNQDFLQRNLEDESRFTGGATSTWRPFTWLNSHATAGIDLASTSLDLLVQPGINPDYADGYRTTGKTDLYQYTGDAGATATVGLSSFLTSKTSIGGQYNRGTTLQTLASATSVSPFGQTVADGPQVAQEETIETVVAGGYLQEELDLSNTLFLTAAIREDGSASFGSNFKTIRYPKFSGSWLLSDEPFWPHIVGLSSVRLRAAYGESGVEPPPNVALGSATVGQGYADGNQVTTATIQGIPLLNLRPEHQHELETGLDVDILKRVHLEATYYYKKSTDALLSLANPTDAGGGNELQNVGEVRNSGYEALLSATLVETGLLHLDASFNGSWNSNKLVKIGANVLPDSGGYGESGVLQGYPTYSYFEEPYTYNPSPADHIITPSDITYLPGRRYLGPAFPTKQISAGATLGLLHNQFRVSAQFDYRGGFELPNQTLQLQCAFDHCLAAVDPQSSLSTQAANVASNNNGTYIGYIQDGSFVRFRELAVTYNVPASIARLFHSRSASLTLSARNLALWTKYTGADPEVSQYNNYNAGAYVDDGGYPPAHLWNVRLNLGL
jgi:TonB-linked SusC/RagA family outer membrane protein